LAKAYADVDTISDAQCAVCLAPWNSYVWEALGEAISG
jgi:hypothetical protein